MNNEDDVMFNWGIGMAVAVAMLTVILQVCFREQDKSRVRVRRDIVATQQEIARASAAFASYVRPEILRNAVMTVYPKSTSVGFNKTISINEL